MSVRETVRAVPIIVVLALLVGACRATTETTLLVGTEDLGERTDLTLDESPEPTPDPLALDPTETVDADPLAVESTETVDAEPVPSPSPVPLPVSPPALSGGRVDFSLERSDVDCDEDVLNDHPDTPFAVAHYVVDGDLGAPCFGEPDERLTNAWRVLATITPSGQLRDLGLFGGYESVEVGETTLAFVNALDFDGSLYQMSINLDEAEADPNELMLTMAHEFSHVFTSLSTQLDRFASPDSCETYYNGEGCYLPDSLMFEWIDRFWESEIDEIDPFGEPTGAAGEERCRTDASFLGSYAASSPEEDFAEAFSAYVFRLPVDAAALQAKIDWFDQQPGLVEFQELAIGAGLGPLDNSFERCG